MVSVAKACEIAGGNSGASHDRFRSTPARACGSCGRARHTDRGRAEQTRLRLSRHHGRHQRQPDIKEVVASLKHQIDIVVECGAKPEIMSFFKNQPVSVKPGQGDGGGHFSSKIEGDTVDAAVVAPEKPVLHDSTPIISASCRARYRIRTSCASMTSPGRTNSVRRTPMC